MNMTQQHALERILEHYGQSFSTKTFDVESSAEDDLMLVFGLNQIIKAGNKQYWGRELGMCWQLLVTELCRQNCPDFQGPIREGADQICDLVIGKDAIDTKYRIGSGDSGTLKKFKQYGQKLGELGYRPILLILRTDNLASAIAACITGGWTVLAGPDAYDYISNATHFDLSAWLKVRKDLYARNQATP